MIEPTQTPTLDYAFPSHLEGRCNFLPLSAELQTRCRDELTALKAENTQLREDLAQAREALVPKPVRKLREVKGVTYEHKKFCVKNGGSNWQFASIALLIAALPHTFTDADHAAIYALKDDPYEPVETVEAVLHDLHKAIYDDKQTFRGSLNVHHYAARIRAARDAEVGGGADA